MHRDTQFSDEFLSAFVDDQVTPEEKNVVHARLDRDEALRRRVHELRRLRNLVQLAYEHLPSPAGEKRRPGPRTR